MLRLTSFERATLGGKLTIKCTCSPGAYEVEGATRADVIRVLSVEKAQRLRK